MSTVPSDFQFTKEHEWVLVDGDVATVGITQYAADALGEIVYVDLPKPGSSTSYMKICGEIESTKSVSEIYSPITGEVSSVNGNLDGAPEIINSEPYGSGWILEISVSGDLPELLSGEEYEKLTA